MRPTHSRICRAFPTRLQLLVGFSVLVAVFVGALALGLGALLRESIRGAALSGAEQTGRVFAELEVGPEEYEDGELTPEARKDLGTAVGISSTLVAARLWDQDSTLDWGEHTRSAPTARADPLLRRAFGGEIASRVASEESGPGSGSPSPAERLLRIYVPIRLEGDLKPRNVLELDMPYAPVQARIDSRTKSLALVLGLGALLFYAALLPSVLRGSRAVADSYRARQVPLQRRLRRAMTNGELELVYQPKLDLATRRVAGVEALMRWRLPDGNMVSPAEFVPLVEPTAVMGALTVHVFELALRQSGAWTREGIELEIAVNISACDLHDGDLPARLADRAEFHGVSPGRFTLEVTESAVSESLARDLPTLTALRERGFRLSIDDFGTGESSLSRLDLAQFEEVKIDRSFIRRLGEQRDPVLVARIVELAHALGATAVAEGVESEAAANCLVELGCDAMQGYHLARPLPPEELAEWLRVFPEGDAEPPRRVGKRVHTVEIA